MPLASFSVERYRSFVRRTTVELRPLTLLFGYNSVGKSALLRALPLLAASAGGAVRGPLNLDADVARKAAYSDIRSRIARRNDLVFTMTWDDSDQPVQGVELHLRWDDDGKRHVIDTLVARDNRGAQILRATDVPGERERYQLDQIGGVPVVITLPFDGLRPIAPADGSVPTVDRAVLEACASRLGSLRESVHWLGAVRAISERKGAYRGEPTRLGGAGEQAGEKLAYDARGPRKLLPRISAALREMFGHVLNVRDDGEEFALELEPVDGAPLRVSIVDVGEGIAQVLPVLVLGAMACEGELGSNAVLAVEQPEMHLHPRAERALAQFFCDVVRAPSRPRLLVETHSENLLLFVQLMVATGQLKQEEVAILWLETLENGESDLRRVALDEEGRTWDWPEGVFSEDVDIARELFLARRNPRR